MELIKEALTFDDVLLLPQFSSIVPANTNINVNLSNTIKLKIPFLRVTQSFPDYYEKILKIQGLLVHTKILTGKKDFKKIKMIQ